MSTQNIPHTKCEPSFAAAWHEGISRDAGVLIMKHGDDQMQRRFPQKHNFSSAVWTDSPSLPEQEGCITWVYPSLPATVDDDGSVAGHAQKYRYYYQLLQVQ